jgi:hypothetical protein
MQAMAAAVAIRTVIVGIRTAISDAFQVRENLPRMTRCGISYIEDCALSISSGIANALKVLKEKSAMTNTLIDKSNNPDTLKQQEDAKPTRTAEQIRMSRLANKFAKRAKERQLRYDDGHNIFTK